MSTPHKGLKMNQRIQNCLNCEMDGYCYECYILSGNEDRDIIVDKLNKNSNFMKYKFKEINGEHVLVFKPKGWNLFSWLRR